MPVLQTPRGWVNAGLRRRAIGTQTLQVTGGAGGGDTFDPKLNGVSLVASPVAWATSHSATAAAIAAAINANVVNHPQMGVFATVATDTVTLKQLRSGAITGVLTCTLTGAATVTIANGGNFTGDTDTWTVIECGAANGLPDTGLYELGWCPDDALGVETPESEAAAANGTAQTLLSKQSHFAGAQLVNINLSLDQNLTYWRGKLAATGRTLASGTAKDLQLTVGGKSGQTVATGIIVQAAAAAAVSYDNSYV
jgi:hypothetical protein